MRPRGAPGATAARGGPLALALAGGGPLALALAGGGPLALAACDAGFASQAIVVDLRTLGVTTTPPEIVLPVDPSMPDAIGLDDLGATEVCALIADPGASRALRWRIDACPPEGDGRCDPAMPSVRFGEGEVADPETVGIGGAPCATLDGGAGLVAVLRESVRADDLAGFGNVSVMLSFAVWPADAADGEAVAEFADKKMRYAPRAPEDRVANTNPVLDGLTVARGPAARRGSDFELPIGRCGEIAGFPIAPGERVQVIPREAAGAREPYVVPTFEGGERRLVEVLDYRFYATAGNWSRSSSGGARDAAGNVPPIDSSWTAPDADELEELGGGAGLDVRLWIVVRDERGGQAWAESCARVVP